MGAWWSDSPGLRVRGLDHHACGAAAARTAVAGPICSTLTGLGNGCGIRVGSSPFPAGRPSRGASPPRSPSSWRPGPSAGPCPIEGPWPAPCGPGGFPRPRHAPGRFETDPLARECRAGEGRAGQLAEQVVVAGVLARAGNPPKVTPLRYTASWVGNTFGGRCRAEWPDRASIGQYGRAAIRSHSAPRADVLRAHRSWSDARWPVLVR